MRRAKVYYNKILSGYLSELDSKNFEFEYEESYFNDSKLPAVSLTLPKTQKKYYSEILFPFFYNMLAEGVNKKLQIRQFRIDENDAFGLLLATAGEDTIGAITVKPIENEDARD